MVKLFRNYAQAVESLLSDNLTPCVTVNIESSKADCWKSLSEPEPLDWLKVDWFVISQLNDYCWEIVEIDDAAKARLKDWVSNERV